MADLNRQMETLTERLVKRGATVTLANGHYHARANGKIVVFARTPSDRRAIRNAYAQVRRELGIDIRLQHKDKRKGSVDAHKIERLCSRLRNLSDGGLTVSEVARVVFAVQQRKNIRGFKSVNAADVTIRRILAGRGSMTVRSHDAVAAGLNVIESSSRSELDRLLGRVPLGDITGSAPPLPRWTESEIWNLLGQLKRYADDAIIAVHRINAVNTAPAFQNGNDLEDILPWTDEQFDFIETEKIAPILRIARMLPQPGETE